MRNIELLFGTVDYMTYGWEHGTEFHEAVGYLSTWNIDGYPFVRIMFDARHCEFIATYWSDKPEDGKRPDYVIGAIWREESKRFSFHS